MAPIKRISAIRRLPGPAATPPAGRAKKKLAVPNINGCREFTGKRDLNGYGIISLGDHGRTHWFKVHRVIWEDTYGPIPPGLMVLHSCDNRACAELTHLKLGSQHDNVHDMLAKGRGLFGPVYGGSANRELLPVPLSKGALGRLRYAWVRHMDAFIHEQAGRYDVDPWVIHQVILGGRRPSF